MIKSAASPSGSRTTVVEPTARMVMPQPSRMDSISSFRSTRDFENLKTERGRLDTFSLPPVWPVTFITPEDCAKAGFFYLQDGDKVQCAFCRGVAGEWEEGDNPSAEHRRHFPRCPFVCNLPVGNIPIGQEMEVAQHSEQEIAAGIDVCGPFLPAGRFLGQEPASVRGAQPLDGNMNDVATSLAIQVCGSGPMHKNLVTYHSRVKSFTSKWPNTSTGQTPESLAEAGFAYLGHLDHVKCFYCDGGLRNWEPGDDPWLEHARWFPNCSFVMLNKGDGFVKDVSKTKPTVAIPQFQVKPPSQHTHSPRRVSDQELRDLMDTSIVQAALEMGMELSKVKAALQRKIQQTGQAFLTTESLLDAVLRRDPEYESDQDTDNDDDDDVPPRRRCPPLNVSLFNGSGSAGTSEASSSSSAEHSSGSDEESPTTSTPRIVKSPASRSASGDSGVSTMSSENGEDQSAPQSLSTEETSGISNKSDKVKVSRDKDLTNQSEDGFNMDEVKKEIELNAKNNMEEELRKLREATQCKICMDNKVEVVFLPCGHLVSCTRCATALSNCAVCRQPIKAYVKTYLS
ncbi:baculoviral IAP repeat-containing protein 7 isoform X2 [Folsomia candida]|uniref:baculoviral IAP repeat-containing protein 7 isoform X2 n=1 Tax=Folsomia candida TaxID=158441 RepID=UPI000B8F6ADF|nr:baculoviral IAP repeat-containing protein 7 isoform X2 [Folsomia candida]